MTDQNFVADNATTTEILEQVIEEIQQTPQEYLPNLLQIVRLFRESVTQNKVEESFRQGWQEAMTGNALPVSELWDGIDAE
ncbi:MAG: hypothetical protein F6K63_13835 [Moorea sp. SIO1G6]|uniref:hypothetical protein n=1 Tax=Moorena sp. SIO1G6 TaxID=2607840 RepID=UPI0013C24E51|nr:hypothetical protein [Moorena sp. SIO1G6]NET65399.1 hypothetical protein [Moorena sp. SIO1G6]